MHSLVIKVNSTVFMYLKITKRLDLNCSHQKKKKKLHEVIEVLS